jgi:hypothetical protein
LHDKSAAATASANDTKSQAAAEGVKPRFSRNFFQSGAIVPIPGRLGFEYNEK